MDAMDQIRETFFQECEELMEVLEDGLNLMESGEHEAETVNAIFRAVHSIKGGAGAFGLDSLVSFAHTFETTLDEVRSDRLEVSSELMRVFLRSADQLRDLISDAQAGTESDNSHASELIEELRAMAGIEEEHNAEDFEFDAIPLDLDLGLPELETENTFWQIKFTPKADMYARGNDCVLLVRALMDLGSANVRAEFSEEVSWRDFDPAEPKLNWIVTLPSDVEEDAIKEVFEFVEDDCEVSISEESDTPAPSAGEDDWVLNSVEEASPEQQVEPKPEIESEPAAMPEPANTNAVAVEPPPSTTEEKEAPKAAAPAAQIKEKSAPAKSAAPRATIRVDLDRVDRLINLIGELVINQSMLAQGFEDAGFTHVPALADGLDEFKQLTRDIQEGVMAIRAQPVKPLFQRMSRIVREASDATGKNVKLVIEGEYTEVDKTIIERLSDPLTHMIRNAVDHGLEKPEVRAEGGKPEEGIVRLAAMHRSGRVLIEVGDDGAGVNRKKVRQIAEEKGLVSPTAELTDSDIDNLLFMPGFSTAKEVSNLSGRGVGMDVVKRSIESLGGRISIASTPRKGTTLSISLPLTLAVMDGMVVRIGNELMVVPIADIAESLRPTEVNISTIATGQKALLVRGEFVPLISVGEVLGVHGELKNPHEGVVLLTETEDGSRHALLIDAIIDQRQVVIKGLEENYGHVPGIAAATILGDGRIALILDIAAVVRSADSYTPSLNQVA